MFYITKDQIIEENKYCLHCSVIENGRIGCCGESMDRFIIGYTIEGPDVNGEYIHDAWLDEDEFTIVEPNELSIKEKLDIEGSLEYDRRGDR